MEKTVLNFEPGVTAVVGPNGCGKSNIFDSIRWVLGEQSVKAMRGVSMEDVIFNGTSSKPALGFAEVSLTFSNESKFFPVDYSEITITRRLFRSGESEYLLNKSRVRLKDINELLMGTGIASESYSLVEQGKIDLVLSSRPEDRRAIFDEAAGITKYKAKKKEALNKLKYTEDNLLRLSDIIAEVKRQIGSVERQAAKARRYKEVFQHLKDLEIDKAYFQLDQFNNQIKELAAEKTLSVNESKDIEAAIASKIENLKDLRTRFNEIASNIELADIDALKADSAAERFNEQIAVNKERIEEYEQRITALTKEKDLISERIKGEQERSQAIKSELSDFDKNAREKENQLKVKKEVLSSTIDEIESARETIKRAKKNILELATNLSKARNDASKLLSDSNALSARSRRLQIERAKVNEEKQGVEANFSQAEASFKEKTDAVQAIRETLEAERENLSNNKLTLKKLEEDIVTLEKKLSNLVSKKEFLQNLKSKYGDFPDACDGIIIFEADNLKPGMGILAKVDTIEQIEENLLNSLQFEGGSKKQIKVKLKIIDLDIEKIAEEEEALEARLAQEGLKKNELLDLIQAGSRSQMQKEEELKKEEISFANTKMQFDLFKEEINKLNGEANIVEEEFQEVTSEMTTLREALEKSNNKVDSIDSEIKNNEQSISQSEELIADLIQKRESQTVDIAQLETLIANIAPRHQSLENSLRIIEASLTQDKEKDTLNQAESEDCRNKAKRLIGQIEKAKIDIESTTKGKEEVLVRLGALKQEKEVTLEKINAIQEDTNQENTMLDKSRQANFQITSKEQEINFKILNLKNRIEASYHVNLDIVGDTCQQLSQESTLEIDAEIEKLKQKVDSYGNVNLVAIEEYEELKKRFEFLLNQQNDLLTAKDSIHKAILKINQTTRKMFKETFEKIRDHFKDYFRLLFNGGDAQLLLSDENNILESGIEIVCRPPGKKLQNISLLSGGEKSLSAIALIFAVFKVKPSPFCVLDEIDAALDESNIDRYNKVLQEFIKTTQFIIITHNKKTITNADVMYGITMQESGVSKIVSVKFAKQEAADASKPKPVKSPALKE